MRDARLQQALQRAREQLAPGGVLRAAINLGNTVLAQRPADNGELSGVSVDLARELAQRLGVEVQFVIFEAAGKVFEALARHAWDVAFLAIDPARGEQIAFTSPYVLIEGAYMVREESPLQRSEQVDRSDVRITVGAGSAYDLYLTRTLKAAQIERHATAAEAFEAFVTQGFDAAAGVRQVVSRYASAHEGLRVLDDSFMTIRQAMGVPKDRAEAAAALAVFIEEMKAQGRVAASLSRSGQTAAVAPSAAL
ncbi:MAG: transporter substrate-binding domain-containing protein [Paraburkholderia sp.]|uniref:transporter substrate-binding domain-containing protein n=1 Tax=Paraburkholderia sp. TaxID=1926495 RepID=UPI0011FBDE75|nr:transporter substrate-binding domain-containing protein [Paraburkholderia sp.]TAL95130.1 MAG: transporter substrate-binding domain-containing protein [Paraburkholderia sp.]